MKKRIIRGASGEDTQVQQKHVPYEADDTIQSRQSINIVDVLCEGEISGLVDGAKSIYLDETPLQNENGTYNFSPTKGVSYQSRNGTQSQTYMSGFAEAATNISVDVEVTYSTPVTRTISDTEVNRVRFGVLIPALQKLDSTGDIIGNEVSFAYDISTNGGPFVRKRTRTVSGKSGSNYTAEDEFELTGGGPWDIRVVRLSGDSSSNSDQRSTYFSYYTEIIDAKLRYPNTAVVGLSINAQQFSNVPKRYYEIKGMLIQVPVNYDPDARTYSGTWNGTFKTAYSNNPAWVLWDVLRNDRYGLGAFIAASQIDKYTLYQIGQYCDELVPDGFGSYEPRFTCNAVLADRSDAYTLIQNLASVFRGMIYWSAGAVSVSQDSPQDAVALYTPSNVIDGKFIYSGSSSKTRHTVALVSWNDLDDFCRQKIEMVEDQTAIATYGIQTVEITAFGCTSRGQAHRLGKWALYTEQYESELVTFKTGLEGIIARPGQIIKIADPVRAGVRLGGRIASATTTTVTIDQDADSSMTGGTLSVLLSDGTIEARAVTGYSGRTLTLVSAFSVAPPAESIWILQTASVEPQTFRVVAVKEEDAAIFSITALRHDPNKYDYIEDGISLVAHDYTDLKAVPGSVQNISITEALYQSGTEVKAKVIVAWDKATNAASYLVRYKRDNENYIELPETQFTQVEVLDAQPGTYTFLITAINGVGRRSLPSSASKLTFGKTAAPSDVSGFSMIPNQGQAYLTWTQASDLDVLVGGQVRIRHTPRTSGQAWKDAVDIIPAVPGTATSAIAPLLEGTYMAKFLDSSGNYSETEAQIVTVNPQALELNLIATVTEHDTFAGTKEDMAVDMAIAPVEPALVLSSGALFDTLGEIDLIGNWDYPGGIVEEGIYYFATTTDIGSVYPTRISSYIDVEAFDIGLIWDQRVQMMDDWADIDGSIVNDVNAELQVRTTYDNPSGSPTWTDWKRVRTGAYNGRGFQFRLVCTSGNENHNLWVRRLEVTLDMEDRVLQSSAPITSGAGAYSVTYADPFYATPSVMITASNMQTGDYFVISGESNTGFSITFKNSAGTNVSRNFSYIAKGYGRKVA